MLETHAQTTMWAQVKILRDKCVADPFFQVCPPEVSDEKSLKAMKTMLDHMKRAGLEPVSYSEVRYTRWMSGR